MKETAYETLGKVWPEEGKSTQDKYGDLFVEHCVTCLPTITRSIQVSVVAALYSYIDKLIILKEDVDDREKLNVIIDKVIIAVKYALGISKHTRLRKEALNVVFCLGKKLKEKKHIDEIGKLKQMFEEVLDDLSNDTQPEIKSRLTDIKNLLLGSSL